MNVFWTDGQCQFFNDEQECLDSSKGAGWEPVPLVKKSDYDELKTFIDKILSARRSYHAYLSNPSSKEQLGASMLVSFEVESWFREMESRK